MKITVPATSANIGPGFDSVGVAVSKYLTIEVLEPADAWHIEHDLGDITSDENNLLISTALQVKSDLQPHKLVMTSDIPLARGLGSSSSVIVAGIELANQLADLKLSDDDKLDIATKIEVTRTMLLQLFLGILLWPLMWTSMLIASLQIFQSVPL